MRAYLDLGNEVLLTLNIEPAGAGFIELNTIDIQDENWQGYYFNGVPVSIKAHANPGYSFFSWGTNQLDLVDATISDLGKINLIDNTVLTASFKGGKKKGISAYPNPTTGWVKVQGVIASEVSSLKVLSIGGRVVFKSQRQNYFDMSNFETGMYIIRIQAISGEYYGIKFIKY